ncbi:MAG: hypothetical protein ACPGU1_17875 [Myxococcota bacterium]
MCDEIKHPLRERFAHLRVGVANALCGRVALGVRRGLDGQSKAD